MKCTYKVLHSSGYEIPFDITRFPTGEVAVNLTIEDGKAFQVEGAAIIMVQGYEPNQFFIIANIKDAIDKLKNDYHLKWDVRLFLGYMPNARYDRHMTDFDGFALRVYCDMINLLKFDSIMIVDPHSRVTPALLKNCQTIKQASIMYSLISTFGIDFDVLVAPDAGAEKKTAELSKKIKKPYITMSKSRDVATGKITGCKLLEDLAPGSKCLIVDDICDGGRTFVMAAEELKKQGASRVDLAVSHGIFSNGVQYLLDNGISSIYTTDTLDAFENETNVNVLNLFKE